MMQASREELAQFYSEVSSLLGMDTPRELQCTLDNSTAEVQLSRLGTHETIKICISTVPAITDRYYLENHGIICIKDQLIGEEEDAQDVDLIAQQGSTRRYFNPRVLSKAILDEILKTVKRQHLAAEINALPGGDELPEPRAAVS